MPTTAYSSIRSALMKIGAIDPSQPLTSIEISDGLKVLNNIMSSWYMDQYFKQQDEMDIVVPIGLYKVSFGKDPGSSCSECDQSVGHVSSINPLNIQSIFNMTNQNGNLNNGTWPYSNQIQVVNRIDTEQFSKQVLSWPAIASYQYGTVTSYLHFFPGSGWEMAWKILYLKPFVQILQENVNAEIDLGDNYTLTLECEMAKVLASSYGGQLSATDAMILQDGMQKIHALRSMPTPAAQFDGAVTTMGVTSLYSRYGYNGNGRAF